MIEAEVAGSIAHRSVRVVLLAIVLLAVAVVLAFLLFADRGPIPYGDGACSMGRGGSALCAIP